MTEPVTVVHRIVLHRWRAGENSADIASADIAKAVSLTEQQVLHVIWAERAERQRRDAAPAARPWAS